MYELYKRVLLPQLPMEWLDVVPPTLHFRPSQEMVWILRVCIGMGEKSAREHLEEEMEFMNSKVVFHQIPGIVFLRQLTSLLVSKDWS